jgi:LmbE family N-acetylglucosaminyl deacetylase
MQEEFYKRVMLIMAHPDDPEFFCGGTVAYFAAAGTEVIYLLLTKGDKGSDNPAFSEASLAALRQSEQQAAANILGVKSVIFFDEKDGELQPSLAIRRGVVREIRRYRPDAVIAPDPTTYFMGNAYINHPDHRAAGEIALNAIFPAARNRMYHPDLLEEGYEPHSVNTILLTGTQDPNRFIDTTKYIDRKTMAICCHESQIKNPADVIERVKARDRVEQESGETKYQEAFRELKIG